MKLIFLLPLVTWGHDIKCSGSEQTSTQENFLGYDGKRFFGQELDAKDLLLLEAISINLYPDYKLVEDAIVGTDTSKPTIVDKKRTDHSLPSLQTPGAIKFDTPPTVGTQERQRYELEGDINRKLFSNKIMPYEETKEENGLSTSVLVAPFVQPKSQAQFCVESILETIINQAMIGGKSKKKNLKACREETARFRNRYASGMSRNSVRTSSLKWAHVTSVVRDLELQEVAKNRSRVLRLEVVSINFIQLTLEDPRYRSLYFSLFVKERQSSQALNHARADVVTYMKTISGKWADKLPVITYDDGTRSGADAERIEQFVSTVQLISIIQNAVPKLADSSLNPIVGKLFINLIKSDLANIYEAGKVPRYDLLAELGKEQMRELFAVRLFDIGSNGDWYLSMDALAYFQDKQDELKAYLSAVVKDLPIYLALAHLWLAQQEKAGFVERIKNAERVDDEWQSAFERIDFSKVNFVFESQMNDKAIKSLFSESSSNEHSLLRYILGYHKMKKPLVIDEFGKQKDWARCLTHFIKQADAINYELCALMNGMPVIEYGQTKIQRVAFAKLAVNGSPTKVAQPIVDCFSKSPHGSANRGTRKGSNSRESGKRECSTGTENASPPVRLVLED